MVDSMDKVKSIRVSKKLHSYLKKEGKFNDTMESIIWRLIRKNGEKGK